MLNMLNKTGRFSAACKCSDCGDVYNVKNIYGALKSPIGNLCESCKSAIHGMTTVTQSALLGEFAYCELTGALTYKRTTASGFIGDVATYSHSGGYLSVSIGKKSYLAHRIIYLMQTGMWPDCIDHINHNRSDNSWCNLRTVDGATNNRNSSSQTNSTTGVVGVSLHKPTNKYRAYISVNSRAKHLGLFESVSAAQAAREKANMEYGYHTNHGK